MSLHFLIDGHNVIKRVNYLKDIRIFRDAQISLIQIIQARRLTGSKNNQVTIVFDGRGNFDSYLTQKEGSIKIIFSNDDSADEVIKRIVNSSSNPKQIIVVTDDRAIVFSTRPFGAKPMSVNEFFAKGERQLGKKAPRRTESEAKELAKVELTHQQQAAINQELRDIWK